MEIIQICDAVKNPKTGKTLRQENNEKTHNIDIGKLVEIIPFESEYDNIRLYIIGHHRDCDGTPLYALGKKDAKMYDNGAWFPNAKENAFFSPECIPGFSEESLRVIN